MKMAGILEMYELTHMHKRLVEAQASDPCYRNYETHYIESLQVIVTS